MEKKYWKSQGKVREFCQPGKVGTLALSQSYCSNEADAWCKRAPHFFNFMQYLKKFGAPSPQSWEILDPPL